MPHRMTQAQKAEALLTLSVAVGAGYPAEAFHVAEDRVTIVANELAAARWRSLYPDTLPVLGCPAGVPLDVVAIKPLAVQL